MKLLLRLYRRWFRPAPSWAELIERSRKVAMKTAHRELKHEIALLIEEMKERE